MLPLLLHGHICAVNNPFSAHPSYLLLLFGVLGEWLDLTCDPGVRFVAQNSGYNLERNFEMTNPLLLLFFFFTFDGTEV